MRFECVSPDISDGEGQWESNPLWSFTAIPLVLQTRRGASPLPPIQVQPMYFTEINNSPAASDVAIPITEMIKV